MECRPLEVTLISARDLKDVNLFGKMDVYVVASLSGDKHDKNKQRTPVHKGGGTSPRWGHTVVLTMDEAEARAGRLTLELEIKAERALGRDKDVGRADVPVKELLEQGGVAGGDGKPKVRCYSVRLPSRKTKGVLEFSYESGDPFAVAAPPAAAKKARELVAAYPAAAAAAAAAPPASSSTAKYPPPVQGEAPYPPPAGYPQRGYGYPPNAAPGYLPQGHCYLLDRYWYMQLEFGYAAPPPAYQKRQRRAAGGRLFGGLLMSDGMESAYEAEDEFDM